jgi:hypothetical protein
MAVRKAKRIVARRAPAFARLGLTFLMLVAFALQSTVMQTHVHIGNVAVTAGVLEDLKISDAGRPVAAKGTQPHDRLPANDDPANCPICQEILYSGHYVAPAAVPILLPSLAVSTIEIVETVVLRAHAPSHNWQGRGPPRI